MVCPEKKTEAEVVNEDGTSPYQIVATMARFPRIVERQTGEMSLVKAAAAKRSEGIDGEKINEILARARQEIEDLKKE